MSFDTHITGTSSSNARRLSDWNHMRPSNRESSYGSDARPLPRQISDASPRGSAFLADDALFIPSTELFKNMLKSTANPQGRSIQRVTTSAQGRMSYPLHNMQLAARRFRATSRTHDPTMLQGEMDCPIVTRRYCCAGDDCLSSSAQVIFPSASLWK